MDASSRAAQAAYSHLLHWFSLHGRISSPKALLLSSIVWLFVIYLLGEILRRFSRT